MSHLIRFMATVSTVVLGSFSLMSKSAFAQAAYGSYVGVGGTFGIEEDNRGEGRQFGGVLAARYKLVELPVSLRAQALIGAGTAVVPTISYDFPLNWQTDVYLGAGASFASGDTPSPVGDQTSFALQPGIDYVVPNSNTVIFGNAIIAFDAYRNGGGTAISVQGGVGVRF
ncbi:MAG TPA: hypothetical protein DD379_12285 [Cyanobacteria bacterium UBA11162]|nr:hypothetical protein [Cyanobacteria bacterium UBA11370]HBL12164.1 hypothetical protein [Cyanobacteria bacterium UBA11162]HBY81123.1 hypothetical protein [Cyanobacteria bacterium UBA11148]